MKIVYGSKQREYQMNRSRILPELIESAWTSYKHSGGNTHLAENRVVCICVSRTGIMAEPLRGLTDEQCALIGRTFANVIAERVGLDSEHIPRLNATDRRQLQEVVLARFSDAGPIGGLCLSAAPRFLDILLPTSPSRPT